jgi:hypothetical protein
LIWLGSMLSWRRRRRVHERLVLDECDTIQRKDVIWSLPLHSPSQVHRHFPNATCSCHSCHCLILVLSVFPNKLHPRRAGINSNQNHLLTLRATRIAHVQEARTVQYHHPRPISLRRKDLNLILPSTSTIRARNKFATRSINPVALLSVLICHEANP